MANITRIKAGEGSVSKKTEKPAKTKKAKTPVQQKPAKKRDKHLPKPLRIITAPFRAIGRYLRDSWLELRHVRWPSRSATWKMFLAVLIYSGLLIAIIMLLDALFTWIFNLILG